MAISEPMTLATDYALGAVAALLGLRLRHVCKPWALALLALAAAAFLGGTWHGIVQSPVLWKATLLSAGLASFAMLVGSAALTLHGFPRRAVVVFASSKLALYSAWVLLHDDFTAVIADSGLSLAIVGALHFTNGWMLAGVATSVAAALVQASGVGLHRHFNHNDLYHVVQAAALFFFYRGIVAATRTGGVSARSRASRRPAS